MVFVSLATNYANFYEKRQVLKAIFAKELLEAIYGYKFLLVLIASIALVPPALYSGAAAYREELRQHEQAMRESELTFRNQEPKPPHSAAHFGRLVSKPPAPLMLLASGVHNALGVSAQIDPHYTPRLTGSRYDSTPMLSIFGQFDFAFLIQVIFSLLALVYSFNLISGEKAEGTLKLIFSNAVSRKDFILGKVAAGLVVLLVPMAVAILIGLVLIAPIFDLSLDSGWLFRAGLIFLVSALYIAMIFLMGIFVSTRTVHAMSSFIALLLIWAGLNFVVPKIAAFVAQSIYRIPSVQEIEMQTAAIRREESEKMVKSFETYRASNPGKSIPPM